MGGMKVSDYVLVAISKEEQPLIEEMVKKSALACEAWLENLFLT